MKKLGLLIVSAVLALITPIESVRAISAPDFPLCSNPTGIVIATYPDGIHGIVGSTESHTGSDVVYRVSDTQNYQCFCSSDGVGIQTNWWKASSLSEEQISQLKTAGWHYIANGDLWGLDSDPYIAQNTTYSCLPGGGSGGNGGTGGVGDGLSDGRSDGKSSCPECTAQPAIGGDVLGDSIGDVLGLAYTGTLLKILSVCGYAAIFFAIGYYSSRKKSHR